MSINHAKKKKKKKDYKENISFMTLPKYIDLLTSNF